VDEARGGGVRGKSGTIDLDCAAPVDREGLASCVGCAALVVAAIDLSAPHLIEHQDRLVGRK